MDGETNLEISEIIAVTSTAVSLASLLIVFWELRAGRKQKKATALIQVYDINRQLMSMGFDKPALFAAIGSDTREDEIQRRYLQLWLNQIALIVELRNQRLFSSAQWESLETDIAYFVENPRFRRDWPKFRRFYPRHFQAFLDAKIADVEKTEAAEAPIPGASADALHSSDT